MSNREQIEGLIFMLEGLKLREQMADRNGKQVPSTISGLYADLAKRVSEGQRGSSLATPLQREEIVPVAPLLLSYEATAAVLQVSLSTVKRLVQGNDLHPITVGGTKRIRVAEIHDFIAQRIQEEAS